MGERIDEFRYGDLPDGGRTTIHGTQHVNVEIGPDGHVAAVWFRCAMVPFTEHHVGADRAATMRKYTPPHLLALIFSR